METAAGIYLRIIFPDGLSKTTSHLSDLQMVMLQATPDCIQVISPDGRLLAMNRTGCRVSGIPDNSEFGMQWLSLLPQDVQSSGAKALEQAISGKSARFLGKSLSTEAVRYWDNLLTPIDDGSGRVLSVLCVVRDVTEKTVLEQQLKETIDCQRLISQEMRHRIKNLFSIASGLTTMAINDTGPTGSAYAVTSVLRQKLGALSRASDAVFAGDSETLANITTLVRAVLQSYDDRCVVDGDPVRIPRSSITTLALFMHELATNSLKYGALSTNNGRITVRWTAGDDMIDLEWIETGGPPISSEPEHRGFGSEMVDRIIRSARGEIRRSWSRDGLLVTLHLPNDMRS